MRTANMLTKKRLYVDMDGVLVNPRWTPKTGN